MTDSAPPPAPARLTSGLPTGDLLDTVTVTVDLPVPPVALAVGAHPDDIEFGAGATISRWAAAGCRVHFLVLTDGSKGTWDPEADLTALVAAREDECRQAASRLLGGDVDPADRVQLLGEIDARSLGFDHRDHRAKVPLGALQPLDDGGVGGVFHADILSRGIG